MRLWNRVLRPSFAMIALLTFLLPRWGIVPWFPITYVFFSVVGIALVVEVCNVVAKRQ
ncbi:MAG: hypothetical protein H8E44_19025 [Planctomycetes bacterium]|nr:hypothetical protein [Planctomycetota bacterium]MBL7043460.1 hypothetical protein [Pirellulaceae bacterium]